VQILLADEISHTLHADLLTAQSRELTEDKSQRQGHTMNLGLRETAFLISSSSPTVTSGNVIGQGQNLAVSVYCELRSQPTEMDLLVSFETWGKA
jgi:hypothetical protein